MRLLVFLGVASILLAGQSAVADKPEGYLDGTDWVGFSADYKLALVEATQEELREQGMTTKYPPLFYLVAVNDFYSNPDHLVVNFADAMSIIGFPLGDFGEIDEGVLSSVAE